MTTSSDRQRFRETLATLADKTKAKIPALNGRVEKALRLALAGDVDAHADGSATVYSSSDPTRRYELIEGVCPCRDWEQAPAHLCQHRLAAGFVRKAATMRAQSPQEETEPAPVATVAAPVAPVGLPEAACSVNCHVMVAGRQVQVTLRGTSEAEVLSRLEQVLQKYPVLPAGNAKNPRSASGETSDTGQPGWCQIHQVPLSSTTKNGRTWQSHKTSDGWCKGR
jgi:hypothetical protein